MTTGTVRLDRGGRAGRRARPAWLLGVVLLAPAAATLLSGRYSDGVLSVPEALFVLLLALALVGQGLSRRSSDGSEAPAWKNGLSSLAAVTAVMALVELTGPARETIFPVVYGLVAVLVAVNGPRVGLCVWGVAAAYEIALGFVTDHRGWGVVAAHVALLGAAAWLVTIQGRSRTPRLSTPTGSLGLGPDEERAAEAQVDEVLELALERIRVSLQSDAVHLLAHHPREGLVRVTASTRPAQVGRELPARAGIVGSVLQSAQAIAANHLRDDFPGTLSEGNRNGTQQVLAVPIEHGAGRRAVLLAHRHGRRPFEAGSLEQLALAGHLLGATMATHRSAERMAEAHYELERFFDASRRLNSALSPEEVYDSTDRAVGLITEFALTAITWVGGDEIHRLVHARGGGLADWVGRRVETARSLAAMVVKTGHYLPLGCEHRPDGAPLLHRDEGLDDLRSLVVLPLRVRGCVRGTLAIGSASPEAFPDRRRGMLEVIANQVAVSLSNARAYARVEQMATVDGLTGLTNRRAFQVRLDEALARAVRSSAPLCLVLLDIDHFKSINDTYGHPLGDEVLRQLGETVRAMLRRTDTAARYGGEEFALILEDTDSTGALVMAERLRQQAAGLTFRAAGGATFSITLSLGIAAHPQDGGMAEVLVERADEALYQAKRSGRNQTWLAGDLRPAPAEISDLPKMGPAPN